MNRDNSAVKICGGGRSRVEGVSGWGKGTFVIFNKDKIFLKKLNKPNRFSEKLFH